MSVPPTRSTIVQLLAAHWCANPHASDSVDGMLSWWLPESQAASLEQLEAALEWLIEHNLIEAKTGPDGRIHYRRSPNAPLAEFARLAAGANAP